jgi:cysteinyl-tRNA synthetase
MPTLRACGLVVLLLCAAVAATGERADLGWVNSFGIQLQNADVDELAASSFDVVVTDYSKDGSDSGAYTAAEIATVQDEGKLVLAYLPLGELSDFRFYWKSSWREGRPGFVGPENPNWPGAFKAKYWKKAFWNRVVQPHLDRILDAGFDGVWLDTVHAYWFWYLQGEDPVQSADRMAKLVRKTAEYGRATAGEQFVVVANNGLAMPDDASPTWRNNYLADIDGVNVESLFYNYWSTEDQAYRFAKLEQFADAGRKIFNIEYIDSSQHDEYFAGLLDLGFEVLGYPAAPDAALDELIDP